MRDLIDRAEAIDALKAHEDYKGYLHGDFETILEALPSAQPETAKRTAESVQNVSEREFIVKEIAYELATGQETVGELIMCKDCKHYNSYFVECESEIGLKHISDYHQWCCNAERRGE